MIPVPGTLSHRTATLALCVASALLLAHGSASAQVSVTTQHNDVARTGANLAETLLTTSNVGVGQFGKLFERSVDGQIYGQPLYVVNVSIPGVGVRNVVYVATVTDSLYAFDADDPLAASPLWSVTYINPAASIVPVNATDVGQACGTYKDFSDNIGIVGTPVIDTVSQTMYLVVRTKESGTFTQRLHAVDIRNGSERPGSPVVIQASVPGTGDGQGGQNTVAFSATTHNQRSALLLSNGVVYIVWAAHCDTGPYHGWMMGYDAATLQQVLVYNTTPNGGGGGIWQSQGPSVDADGNIYVVTSNGSFDGDVGGSNRGNSFLKLSPAGMLLDWFTPYNWAFLNSTDMDLGIQGALLVPETNLVVGGGKEGVFYVLNRGNMGRFQSGSDGQIVQRFQASTAGHMNGSPVYWQSPSNGPVIYLWPAGDPLKAFRLINGLFQTTPVAQSSALAPAGMPGAMLSLSANGSVPGTGIIWAALSLGGSPNQATQPGIVRAYDADDVTVELWNSEQNAARDSLGNFAKFSSPTIANGKVYLATFSNKLVVYGLLSGPGNQAPVVNAGPNHTITLPNTVSLTGTATDDGKPNPPGALTTTWSRERGPGTVTFTEPNALSTTASFSAPGTYTLRLTASDSALVSTSDLTVTVNPVPGSSTGLTGQYYNDPGTGARFTTLALTRTDATVNFDWQSAAPAPGVQPDNFSVRWTGQVQAPVTGAFTFSTVSDDGVRLWVNGQLVIDNWTPHADTTNTSTPIALVADAKYDIRMELFEAFGWATAKLLWAYPGQTPIVIPQSRLFPAVQINQPPAVNAGSDQTIAPPYVAALNGTATDDGLPTPPGTMTVTWTKLSGREDADGGTVVFANPHALSTSATFGAEGIYVLRLTVSDGAITVSDDITIVVTATPPPSGTGTGLTGQYYNDQGNGTYFSTLALTRTDATVDFDWIGGAPAPGVQADNFSVRWTGQVQAPVTGNFTFSTVSDDGVRLWVNGQLVIDNWIHHAATTNTSAAIALVADAKYDIRMELFEAFGWATAKLLWAYPGQTPIVIPQARLFPAVQINQPPAVNAGPDQTITPPYVAALNGTATDDGLPTPPGRMTVTWTKLSGPADAAGGTVVFGNPNAMSTTATFDVEGTYVLRLTVSDSAFTVSDDITIVVTATPPPSGTGTGLTGQYYNDQGNGTYFTTLALTRTDATVDFDWGSGAPAPGVQADAFSVRWTGQVQAPVTGAFTFSTVSDDGVRLWINGQLVIDNWIHHAATTNTSAALALVADAKYDIRMELFEAFGAATAKLLWAYPGQAPIVIPQARLFPAVQINQPPTVSAGPDQTITPPYVAALNGTATDDGLPTPPGTMTVTWTKLSGPADAAGGTVVFADPNALSTTATFRLEGTYVLRLTVSDSAITVSDDITIVVTATLPPSGTGTGLTGQYYNDPGTGTRFTTLALTRTDATVNFDWKSAAPAPGVQPDNFSVRWTGQVQAPATGDFTFSTVSDDGVRLWVNGQLVIDNWTPHADTTNTSPPLALIADAKYDIRMELFEAAGWATAKLLWAYPGQPQIVIPKEWLSP
jgi:PA14 domain-containing protein/K319-like protein